MKKIIGVSVGIMVLLLAGFAYADTSVGVDSVGGLGLGAGVEGVMGMNQIQIISSPQPTVAKSPAEAIKVSAKPLKSATKKPKSRKKQMQTYEEFVVQRKKQQLTLPSEAQFAKTVEQYKTYLALEKTMLDMDYMAFKSTLIGAAKLKLGTSISIKTLKIPPQGKFKKLAQAKQREYAFKMSLEDSDYDEYKSTLDATLGGQSHRPSVKALTKEEFGILSSNLRKRKAVNRALLANDFDSYIVARKAEQPILPSREEFANTK